MPRVRMEEKCELKSWDEVNLNLAEIGEQERKFEQITATMQEEIDEAKLKAEDAAKPCQERIEELSHQIKLFADKYPDDFKGKKTKLLTFGSLGYRKSTKIRLPRGSEKVAAMIKLLKAKRMSDCVVKPPEKIDKEALKKYSVKRITGIGATLKIEDVFWYEVDREQLEETE